MFHEGENAAGLYCEGNYNLWKWLLCWGSEYARVTQGSEYAWTITGYAWLCLNMPISVWMAFVLHLPIVNPSLKKESQTVFLKSKNLIFYSSWKYFILFFVLDCINLLLPLGTDGTSLPNDIPNKYIWCFFNYLFIYSAVAVLPLFGASKDLIRDWWRL